MSSATKLEKTVPIVEDQPTEEQISGVNRESDSTSDRESETTPMEVIDDQTILSVTESEDLQVSVVEGQSNEPHSSGINIETEVTHEKNFIVLTLSFVGSTPEVCRVDDSLNEVCSSSVNRETNVAPEKDFDDLTDDVRSQPVSTTDDSCSNEWKISDSVNKTAGKASVKDFEDAVPSVTEDLSLDLQPCNTNSPGEDSHDLTLPLSSASTEQVSIVEDASETQSSHFNQATDNIAIQVLNKPVSTANELSTASHSTYLGADKKTGDSTTYSNLLTSSSKGNDPKKQATSSEEDLSTSMSTSDRDKTNDEPMIDAEDPVLCQAEDCSFLKETACTSEPPTTDREDPESLCEDPIQSNLSNSMSTSDRDKANDEPMVDAEDPVLCQAEDCSSLKETACTSEPPTTDREDPESLREDGSTFSVNDQTDSALNRKKKTFCYRDCVQPPKKKLKLSKNMKVPVKDILGGVHTCLCKYDCTLQHNPLVLAVSTSNNLKLKTCLENHLRLAINGNWESARSIEHFCHPLVHMVMLFGRCDLLEFLLKERLCHADLSTESPCTSPFHTVIKQIQHYMPGSSHEEKVAAFQRMLKLLVHYNSNVLLVKEPYAEDTILHTCAKKIRDLSRQMKAEESLLQVQQLLTQRKLLDILFREMVETFQRLSRESSLTKYQVLKLFNFRNKSGETVDGILEEEESIRKGCSGASNEAISKDCEEGNTVFIWEDTGVDVEHVEHEVMGSHSVSFQPALSSVGMNRSKTMSTSHNCLSDEALQKGDSRASSTSAVETKASNQDGLPNRSVPVTITASNSMCATTQTLLSSTEVNPSEAINLTHNSLSVRKVQKGEYKGTSTDPLQTKSLTLCGLPNKSSPVTMTDSNSVCVPVSSTEENPPEAMNLSGNCPSVQDREASTELSAAIGSSQTTLATQDYFPNEPVLTEATVSNSACASVQTHCTFISSKKNLSNGCLSGAETTQKGRDKTASTEGSVSEDSSQAKVSALSQADYPFKTVSLSKKCLLSQAPDHCPKQVASTDVPVSVHANQSGLHTETVHRSTTHSDSCLSNQAPKGCANKSATTAVSFVMWPIQVIQLPFHGVNPSQTLAELQKCLSAMAPDQCASRAVSSPVCSRQTTPSGGTMNPTLSSQAVNTSTAMIFVGKPSSVQTRDQQNDTNQSASSTVSASLTCSSPQAPVSSAAMSRKKPGQKDMHTFLCESPCHVRHHELIQLLCATPDHRSVDTPPVEHKSLSNFRNYLKEKSWDVHSVIPDPSPGLCFSIVHLACLLGKYKALEVLSEIGFDPLTQTTSTKETPLHMAMRLIRHFEGTSKNCTSNLFLSDVVVNILKTLSRFTHAKSLLSVKDYNGNTVLHLLAEMMGQSKLPVSTAMFHVYLFRVFMHFQLKGLSFSEARLTLSSSLKEGNDTGQSVEFLLMRSLYGAPLLKCLRDLSATMDVTVRRMEESSGLRQGQNSSNVNGGQIQKEGCVESEFVQSSSAVTEDIQGLVTFPESCTVRIKQEFEAPATEVDAHLPSETEPGSLVDFVLSHQCGISSSDKRTILAQFRAEYDTRLKSLAKRVSLVKKEIPQSLKRLKLERRTLEKEAQMTQSTIIRNTQAMREAIDDRNKRRRRRKNLDESMSLIDELTKAIETESRILKPYPH